MFLKILYIIYCYEFRIYLSSFSNLMYIVAHYLAYFQLCKSVIILNIYGIRKQYFATVLSDKNLSLCGCRDCCEQVEAQFEKTTPEVEAPEPSTLSSIVLCVFLYSLLSVCCLVL